MNIKTIIATTAALLTSMPAYSAEELNSSAISFRGEILNGSDLSAAARFGDMLVIAGDEAIGPKKDENIIQLLERLRNGDYRVSANIPVYQGNKKSGRELDIEAIAVDGRYIYVAGSHAMARKKGDGGKPNNLRPIKPEPARKQLYRLTFDTSGRVTASRHISLAKIIAANPDLAPYAALPAKENGIDIEGLAVRDDLLYAGFRGPVLANGFVPVLRFSFDNAAATATALYVNLNGRGIRDMVAVSDGFLLLAGPVGNEPSGFRLLHWDGKDSLAGSGRITPLGGIAVPDDAKAEGLALMHETDSDYEVIVLFDGAANGTPRRYTISKR